VTGKCAEGRVPGDCWGSCERRSAAEQELTGCAAELRQRATAVAQSTCSVWQGLMSGKPLVLNLL